MNRILALTLTLATAVAHAQTTVPFSPGERARATADSVTQARCSFLDSKLPPDTIVVAAGAYTGRKLDYQIDQSGHQATQLRSVFGTEAVRVYNRAVNGLIDIVESTRPKTAYETAPATPPASFKDPDAPLAGDAGLSDAVAKGLLRPATQVDIEQVRDYYRAQAAKSPAGKVDIPPIAGASPAAPPEISLPSISIHRSYVVLKQFAYPAGLYGAHGATFIVPQGVATPTGNPGHSSIFDLNTSTLCAPHVSLGPCRRFAGTAPAGDLAAADAAANTSTSLLRTSTSHPSALRGAASGEGVAAGFGISSSQLPA